jgi:PLP dependent protein
VSIASNLAAIRGRMAAAAQRAGRDPSSITLVAVSKFQPVSAMEDAYLAGQRAFGENRVQEAEEKRRLLAARIEGPDPLTLDLIGPLQSNKARKAVNAVSRVQSIDSVEIADRVGRIATEFGRTMPVLIQVDLAGEATKSGIPEADLAGALATLSKFAGIEVRGLMAIPPFLDNPEDVRPYFKRLRELRDQCRAEGLLAGSELSMGMSHDFEVAIEEGATIVRVGTAIFGERPPRA